MPQGFYNPYFFLPVTKGLSDEETAPFDEIKKGEHDHIRHDLYHPDRHTGAVTCTLTTRTPTLVGNLHLKKEGEEDNEPAYVVPYRRNGWPAIPGNSLRGMIGSLIEALSNSSLRVLEDREYSVRKKADQALSRIGRIVKQGKNLYIEPLGVPQKLPYCNKDRDINFNDYSLACADHIVSLEKNSDGNPLLKKGPIDQPDWTSGYLRITNGDGQNQRKKKFIPIPNPPIAPLPIDPEAISKLYRLCNQVEKVLLPEGYKDYELKEGYLLYFKTNSAGTKVTELSYSAIWRDDFAIRTSFDAFRQLENGHNLLPWGWKEPEDKKPRRRRLTPAEYFLGVVEEVEKAEEEEREDEKKNPGRNLASRLRFSDALPTNKKVQWIDGRENPLKILSSPKPPSEKMYFHKQGAGLNPNGRKVYLHHREEDLVWETQDKEENKNQKLLCHPIDREQSFKFSIRFHNLSDAELSLLLTALKPDDDFQHRLGLGKPLGLGSVKLTIDKLETKDLKTAYGQWKSTLKNENWQKFLSKNQGLIDEDVLGALRWLGNPANIEHLVHYPLTRRQWDALHSSNKAKAEQELFRWFVNNGKKAEEDSQSLKKTAKQKQPCKLKPN